MKTDLIANAIGRKENALCRYVKTVAVVERFKGKTVWEGEVMIFALDRPPDELCYVWVDPDENLLVTVLNRPPVDSPETAVRAYIVSRKEK
jgi:hypothetical protein